MYRAMARNEREMGYFQRQDVLTLTKRQTSLIVSALILLFFFVFMAGYFFGKRTVLGEFVQRATQDSFADQIYYASLSSSYDDQASSEQEERVVPTEIDRSENVPNDEPQSANDKFFYAQLVGFGTEPAALQCVERLAQKGIKVHVKKKLSKTAQGRHIAWYQVVTPSFEKINELDALVQQIKRLEKIKNNVRIVSSTTE